MTKYFWYFICYGFIGFLLEVAHARVTHNPKKDRKCLYLLPLCPVYGLGGVAVLLLPSFILEHPLLLLFAGGVAATLAEYAMSLFYERVLRVSFWDYSAFPCNINGRVCLHFSLMWGVLIVSVFYTVHPFFSQAISSIPPFWTVLMLSLTAADTGVTCYLLRRFQTTEVLRWYRSFA